ncbi:MAG TPA: ABC transporter permease [Terriglobia bacterium]|nr:ABC transporter permease [Terriglobia bacterium]
MTTLMQDLRYALRMMVKSPGFTAVALITLALGIGVNTAIFSVVNAVVLKPLPYPDATRLVTIWVTEPSGPGNLYPDTGPDFVDWKAQNKVFDGMAAVTIASATLTGTAEPLQLEGFEVSPEIFPLLGATPFLGRNFTTDETQSGHDGVVILSHGLWQRAFGGDRSVVGTKITLDGRPMIVAGVMPRDFQFPHIWGNKPEYWIPINLQKPDWRKSRGNHWMWVIGRMKSGVTLDRAKADMETISNQLTQQYPDTNTGVVAKVVTLQGRLTENVRPALLVLFATVGFLMLIACVNVANLMLAKAVGRQHEIAVRVAVGCGRWRLIRQLLTEGVLLFLVGGAAGLLVGLAALRLLLHAAPLGYVPEIFAVKLDAPVFAFTFLVAFLAGSLAGLVPALQSSNPDLQSTLKESMRTVATPHRVSRTLLTAGEIALALMMSVGAGLALKSLVRLLGVEPGFDSRSVLTAQVSLPEARYMKDEERGSFYQRLQESLQTLPGVTSASFTSTLPLEGGSNGTLIVEGQAAPKNMWSSPLVEWCTVMPGYFQTLRIPILRGRDFIPSDAPKAPLVAIVNHAMADRFWPNQDPIGKRFSQDKEKPKWDTVVGEVGDVREYGLDQDRVAPEAYFPEFQNAYSGLTMVVRSSTPPLSQLSAVTATVHELDSQLPVFQPRELAEVVHENSAQQRFMALLMGLFAGLALLLAAVGIYGVIAHSVAQRTHELGIRMALGAGRGNVLGMVVGEGLRMALAGVAVGLAGAWGLTRFIASLLYGVRPTDPVTFALAPILLIVVALAACYIPAYRATQVDPVEALRYE